MEKKKRVHCDRCHRPINLCLCSHINQIKIDTQVTILQSKDEAKHPFNTARFAQASCENIKIVTSDEITDELIDELLTAPAFLLFKNENSRPISKENLPKGKMIVLDGTWKKAKGVYYKWPKLSELPCYHLENTEDSIYSSIRKSCADGHLSTLEAIGVALKELGELDQDSYKSLISPLIRLIEQQESFKK